MNTDSSGKGSKKEDTKLKENIKSNKTNNMIKKPIMTEEEYKNMMKKRNLLQRNSKYRPLTLLFGRQSKSNGPTNNANIQINNFTTYLTSIETIFEEKYQQDGQTVIDDYPNYSMKQLNYKYKKNYFNQITVIYIKKINELEDKYSFTNDYLLFIIKIFENLCKHFISSLLDIFIKNIKPNIKYFQEILSIFSVFSEKIKNIQINNKEEYLNRNNQNKVNNLTYIDCNLNDSIKKITNAYADKFTNISTNINNLFINNPLLTKIDTIELKFDDILKKMAIYINKLIHRQDKFNNKYKKDVLPFFSNIKLRLNDPSLFQLLTLGQDFIFIEYNIISYINKINSKISQFYINMEFLFKECENIFYDYFELLDKIIKLYYQQNKDILNISNLLPNKSKAYLDNLLKIKDIRKHIEDKYSFNNILENNDNEKLFNEINHSLLNYRDLLLKYNFVKNKDIENVINFNLINYNSSTSFLHFLMNLIPLKFPFKFNDVIELKMKIKRNSGILKGWKNSTLIITYQGHIYIFDNDGDTLNKNQNQLNNRKLSKKEIINSIIEDDIKKENDENEVLYEAIKNNKFVINYWRSTFKMVRLISKDNKKLVQIYDDYMGYRQYRPTLIDVLNDNNLNILINIFSNIVN